METTVITEESKEIKLKQPAFGSLFRDRAWLAMCVIAVAALIIIYKSVFEYWWQAWFAENSHYSHGILVPFIAGFMVWFNRKKLSKMVLEPNILGLLLIIPVIVLQFAAYRASVPGVVGLTFPIVLISYSLAVFGRKITWVLLFPLLFLFFMIIPPMNYVELLSIKIQTVSAAFATKGLNLIGIQAVEHGNVITLPNGVVATVAEECSGFRMLIALTAFASFFAYIKDGPLWGRISLVCIVVPLSILTNIVRILLITLAGQFFGESAMMMFHDYSGYIVLVVAFIVLAQLAKVVKCRDFRSMPVS